MVGQPLPGELHLHGHFYLSFAAVLRRESCLVGASQSDHRERLLPRPGSSAPALQHSSTPAQASRAAPPSPDLRFPGPQGLGAPGRGRAYARPHGLCFTCVDIHQIPRLNSTRPSFPPCSWNSASNVLALTACCWGNAASASGRAKMLVAKMRPSPSLAQTFPAQRLPSQPITHLCSQASSSSVSALATLSSAAARG